MKLFQRPGSKEQQQDEDVIGVDDGEMKLPSPSQIHATKTVVPPIDTLNRINSDYLNQHSSSQETTVNGSSSTNHLKDIIQQKRLFIEKMQKAINLSGKEMFETSLSEYKLLQTNIVVETQPAFKAVLYYNMAVCYHRQSLMNECVQSLQTSLNALYSLDNGQNALIDIVKANKKKRAADSVDTKEDSEQQLRDSADRLQSASSHLITSQQCPPTFPNQCLPSSLPLQKLLCRVTLQLCAILSQTNNHDMALDLAQQAHTYSRKITEGIDELAQKYMQHVQERHNANSSCYLHSDDQDSSAKPLNNQQQDEDGDYTPIDVRKARSDANVDNLGLRIATAESRQSIATSDHHQLYGNGIRMVTAQSVKSSKTNESSFISQSRSTTRLHFDKKIQKSSRSRNSSRKDNESLERIYTFHLKKSMPITEAQRSFTSQVESRVTTVAQLKDQLDRRSDGNSSTKTYEARGKSSLITSRTYSQQEKAFYVSEKTVAQQDNLLRNIMPIVKLMKEVLVMKQGEQQVEYPLLKSQFTDDSDFNQLTKKQTSKLRNTLGLSKSSVNLHQPNKQVKKDSQWIYHLNIGNVMQLNTIPVDEMLKLEIGPNVSILENSKTCPQSPDLNVVVNSQNSSPDQAQKREQLQNDTTSSLEYIKHELSKDELLDKLVLIAVSLFCMGTELRFKSQQYLPPSKKQCQPALQTNQQMTVVEYQEQQMYQDIRAQSVRWHSNAIHVACLFLPEECPLVGHMINSYKKHHLRRRSTQSQQKRRSSIIRQTLRQPSLNRFDIKKEQTKAKKVTTSSVPNVTVKKNISQMQQIRVPDRGKKQQLMVTATTYRMNNDIKSSPRLTKFGGGIMKPNGYQSTYRKTQLQKQSHPIANQAATSAQSLKSRNQMPNHMTQSNNKNTLQKLISATTLSSPKQQFSSLLQLPSPKTAQFPSPLTMLSPRIQQSLLSKQHKPPSLRKTNIQQSIHSPRELLLSQATAFQQFHLQLNSKSSKTTAVTNTIVTVENVDTTPIQQELKQLHKQEQQKSHEEQKRNGPPEEQYSIDNISLVEVDHDMNHLLQNEGTRMAVRREFGNVKKPLNVIKDFKVLASSPERIGFIDTTVIKQRQK